MARDLKNATDKALIIKIVLQSLKDMKIRYFREFKSCDFKIFVFIKSEARIIFTIFLGKGQISA